MYDRSCCVHENQLISFDDNIATYKHAKEGSRMHVAADLVDIQCLFISALEDYDGFDIVGDFGDDSIWYFFLSLILYLTRTAVQKQPMYLLPVELFSHNATCSSVSASHHLFLCSVRHFSTLSLFNYREMLCITTLPSLPGVTFAPNVMLLYVFWRSRSFVFCKTHRTAKVGHPMITLHLL